MGRLSGSHGAGAAWECQKAAATSEFWEDQLKTKVCWLRVFFKNTGQGDLPGDPVVETSPSSAGL